MAMSEGDFLEAMQKLIFGNAMTSTYKLALIRAIVELVTGQPAAKEGESICISYTALADAFLRIYWNQGRDYLTAPGKECKIAQSANQHDGFLRIQTLIDNFTKKVKPALAAHESLTWYRASQLPEYVRLQKACIRYKGCARKKSAGLHHGARVPVYQQPQKCVA